MSFETEEVLSSVLNVLGKAIRVALDDPEDEIQRYIVSGDFYEKDQLEYHRTLIPRRGRILDLGGNIGNHALYYATVCSAELVVSVEPSARSCRLFNQTIEWNELNSIELVSGVAVGAAKAWATLDETEANLHNLGGTSVIYHLQQVDRSVPVRTGDDILDGRPVDFIKIDVEGTEFSALTGLQGTIQQQSPILAVEVMPPGRLEFYAWCRSNQYRIERTFQMYRGIMNFVCIPER